LQAQPKEKVVSTADNWSILKMTWQSIEQIFLWQWLQNHPWVFKFDTLFEHLLQCDSNYNQCTTYAKY